MKNITEATEARFTAPHRITFTKADRSDGEPHEVVSMIESLSVMSDQSVISTSKAKMLFSVQDNDPAKTAAPSKAPIVHASVRVTAWPIGQRVVASAASDDDEASAE
jgi:hypothetical protein